MGGWGATENGPLIILSYAEKRTARVKVEIERSRWKTHTQQGRTGEAREARRAAGLHVAQPLSKGGGVSRAPQRTRQGRALDPPGMPAALRVRFPRAERSSIRP